MYGGQAAGQAHDGRPQDATAVSPRSSRVRANSSTGTARSLIANSEGRFVPTGGCTPGSWPSRWPSAARTDGLRGPAP